MTNPLTTDLNEILDHTSHLWEKIQGQRVFFTGDTGFFGCWLLESLLAANNRLDLGVSAVVLTRDPEAFARNATRLAADPAIRVYSGSVPLQFRQVNADWKKQECCILPGDPEGPGWLDTAGKTIL